MSNTSKTAHQIIDETVEFYSTVSNRSVQLVPEEICRYIGPNNTMCAVARCVKNPSLLVEGCGILSNNFASIKVDKLQELTHMDKLLKDEYKCQPAGFWQHLQSLHDYDIHWNLEKGGLSENGKGYVREIKAIYK